MKFLLLLNIFSLACCADITLDEAYKRCKGIPRDELEPCILKLVKELKPLIRDGIPELGWGADSCNYDSINLDRNVGMNHVQCTLHSGTLEGMEEFDLTYLKIDYANRLAIWSALIPQLLEKGRYYLDAKILQVPLYGNGTFWSRLDGFHIYGVSTLEVVNINGELHLQEKDTELTFSYKNAAMRLNNLFDGNSIMQEAASVFLNMNIDALMSEFKGAANGIFRKITDNHVNKALSLVKLDDLAGSEFIKEAFFID